MTSRAVVIEPIGADLVALAEAHALDASTFPHASLPLVTPAEVGRVLLARRQPRGPVVGFVAMHDRRPVMYVSGIAVAVDARREGVGRLLLRAAITAARQRRCGRVELHVSTTNPAALRLYLSEGFRLVARVPGFYAPDTGFGDGGAAWHMSLG